MTARILILAAFWAGGLHILTGAALLWPAPLTLAGLALMVPAAVAVGLNVRTIK